VSKPTVRILSAGAAQAVTERLIEQFKRERACDVTAEFGAVGAMKARVTSGAAVDVITLTHAMIDELADSGFVRPGSRIDLGKVGTGVAVRVGAPVPDISGADRFRTALLAAEKIVCPDPAIATAGKVVMALLEKLGVAEQLGSRMQFFPNGYAAMHWLSSDGGFRDVGITQVTEILPNKGIIYAGALPDAFQMKTVYSAAVAAAAKEPELAKDFVSRFAAPDSRKLLKDAGYEIGEER
jgi:molybdate transport system substrate-binding protein